MVLTEYKIECRPIVTGNFLKNSEALKYFDYEVFGETVNAEYIDENGLFVGNCEKDLNNEIDFLYKTVNDAMSMPKKG